MSLIEITFAIIIAYLFGSISSAVIVCKIMRLPDPRTQGSQNPGATNVMRIGGKKAAAITLAGDVLKGIIPVLLARWFGLEDAALAAVTFAAFIGHLFPIFFRFAGGKGVATLLGCLIGLSPLAAVCWGATWLFVAKVSRYSSLASLTASILAPLYVWGATGNAIYAATFALMAALLAYRHHSNIVKLMAGTESKIGSKK
jgi:glycerol-3-phosphate acyltransferase PlsY